MDKPAQDYYGREQLDATVHAEGGKGHGMRGDPSSDGYGTLNNHPTDRHPLSQTRQLEESSRRASLHGHEVNVAPPKLQGPEGRLGQQRGAVAECLVLESALASPKSARKAQSLGQRQEFNWLRTHLGAVGSRRPRPHKSATRSRTNASISSDLPLTANLPSGRTVARSRMSAYVGAETTTWPAIAPVWSRAARFTASPCAT